MLDYSQELNETVNEAMSVRTELQSIMQEAIEISQALVNDFEEKVIPADKAASSMEIAAAKEPNVLNAPEEEKPRKIEIKEVHWEPLISCERIRVYELARELDMSSKELLNIVKDLGFKINNHMNMLDEEQVQLVRENIIGEKQVLVEATAEKREEKNTKKEPEPTSYAMPGAEQAGNRINLLIKDTYKAAENYSAVNLTETKTEPANHLEKHIEKQVKEDEEMLPMPQLGFSVGEMKAAHPYIAVKTLYDKGYTVREIAKLLDRGQGEISLILNIAKKKAVV